MEKWIQYKKKNKKRDYKEEKPDFVITFNSKYNLEPDFSSSAYTDYLVYSLTADTSFFKRNGRITVDEIEFLNRYVPSIIYQIRFLLNDKSKQGKYYNTHAFYDFSLSSKWSEERIQREIVKRLDSIPYNNNLKNGPYTIRWE